MEPQIQYAGTEDGVNIAKYTIEEGAPFVDLPALPFSHIQLEWHIPDFRGYYERLAERRKHVRFDARGVGPSDRNVSDCSLRAKFWPTSGHGKYTETSDRI